MPGQWAMPGIAPKRLEPLPHRERRVTKMKEAGRLQGLNRGALKLIAAAAMLIDHIGWRFFAFESPLSQLFHTFGRIALPLMCFFLAEGYAHTRSRKRYALRLLLFALLSQIPFALFQGTRWYGPPLNVMFTLLFCFLALLAVEEIQNNALRGLAVLGCIALTWWCDWPVTAVLFTLAFWTFRGEPKKQAAAFSAVAVFYFCSALFTRIGSGDGLAAGLFSSLYTLGVFLALVLLLFYSGRKGHFLEGRAGKWFFYAFYPAHLLVLSLL